MGAVTRRTLHEALLALVVVAVYLNQLAFTLYVLAVHDGDAGFVAQYLPAGWFELWTPPFLVELAAWLPRADLLAPSVLHVQAFWELPLVLLGYLTVLCWLSEGAYRRVATSWMLWATSVAWTVVFCAIEILLASPWTTADVAVRVASGLLTPWALGLLVRDELPGVASGVPSEAPGSTPLVPGDRPTAARLLVFGASTALLGYLVLVVYDTALLYNLGRLPDRLPAALVALALLVGLRGALGSAPGAGLLAPPSAVTKAPGRVVGLVGACLRHGLVLFLIPALAIRYVMSYFGGLWAGVALVLVIASAAVVLAARETLHGLSRRPSGLVVVAVATSLVVGCALGVVAAGVGTAAYVEETLGRGAVVAFAGLVATAALADRLLAGRLLAGSAAATRV
jgi:hypothetical protein